MSGLTLYDQHPAVGEMEQPSAFFPSAVVAIVGLGLIGGSLALALRGRCRRLIGIDHDPAVVRQALERNLADQVGSDPAVLLPQADLVIIAIPVRASLQLINNLPSLLPGHTLVMDVGSTKLAVMSALEALPGRFDVLGGHPLCGKETGTLANAEAGLFRQAVFALVPTDRTTSHARAMALELVSLVGARPFWVEAEQHDRWVAGTSHLPHLIATALALSTPPESGPLSGPGFRSTSRLAAGSAEMKTDMLVTNRQAVLEALSRYRQQLDALSDLLERSDLDGLLRLLALGAERRQTILEMNDGK